MDLTADEGNKNMQRLYGKTYKSINGKNNVSFAITSYRVAA